MHRRGVFLWAVPAGGGWLCVGGSPQGKGRGSVLQEAPPQSCSWPAQGQHRAVQGTSSEVGGPVAAMWLKLKQPPRKDSGRQPRARSRRESVTTLFFLIKKTSLTSGANEDVSHCEIFLH